MSGRRSLLSLNLPKDILASLTRNGYETIQDLGVTTAEVLAKDLNISLQQAEEVQNCCKNTQTLTTPTPITQSVSIMLQHSERVKTQCAALDVILGGGLPKGHILEISGPPGSPKEKLVVKIARQFAEAEGSVLFVDCENMTSPTLLSHSLKRCKSRVRYLKIHSLARLLLFLHQAPAILNSSKRSLLVINSVSFPFQSPDIGIFQRGTYLERLKHHFSMLCASDTLTIVTSSQLSTKMVNADGTRGSFDTGGRGIMLPQLGPTYLPNNKSYRVLLSPNDPISGVIKLLSSPKYPPGTAPQIVEMYSIVDEGDVV